MKKIYLFLLAAAGIFAAASCARVELADPSQDLAASGETTTLTLSFDQTKTALVDGKTTWAEGDKIRIYNSDGKFHNDVTVPAEAVGKAAFDVDVNLKDTLFYAVYPVEADKGVSGGKINVTLPANPDGRFASANICVAATKGTTLSLKNVTAVLKVKITSGNVVEILQVNAKNALVGNLAVEFDGDDISLTPSSTGKSATVAVGGIDGDYYIPVIPGTYAKEFSITALRGNGGYQNKIAANDNEVKINTIFDLGAIGDNLTSGLDGEGTQDKPFLIRNLGEWTAFTASVNLGKNYSGEYVSLDTDLVSEAILTPVGYANDDSDFAFGGIFLGNNHTVKVDLDGANCKSDENVALFGNVSMGASISNLTVEGKVVSPGNTVAGIVGWARGNNGSRVTLENLTNNAEVTAPVGNVAGVVAYAYFTDIKNCKNTAKITSTSTTLTGLLLPYYSYYTITGLDNNAVGTWNNGTGGIAGYAQNSTISDCENSADIAGFIKVAGIVGTAYWTNVTNANNSGNIKATGNGVIRADSQYGSQWGSLVAGIAGWVHVQGTVTNCINNGKVTGVGGVGGIVSLASCGNNASSGISIKDCVNNGDIQGSGQYSGGTSSAANVGAGGICAAASLYTYWSGSSYQDKVVKVENCVNKGNVSVDNATHVSDAVGGIVGNCYNPNRQNGTSVSVVGANSIINCVNEGQVTGGYYVGGVVGLIGSRYGQIPVIKNCANHGKVASNTPTGTSLKYSGILAGGLVGGVMAYNTTFRSRNMFNISNCYNDADIVFAHEDLATPYIGGIIGSTWGSGTIQNVYNTGNISLSTGAEFASGVTNALGALVGYQNASVITYSYYLKDILNGVAVSSKSAKPAAESVVGFDSKYEFAGVVSFKDKDYENLLDVLNAWVLAIDKTAFAWKAGSKGPVFDI